MGRKIVLMGRGYRTVDVIIIKGDPAGLYTLPQAGLKSLLLERAMLGGQMVNSALLLNYPCFPEGIRSKLETCC